jgi:transposase
MFQWARGFGYTQQLTHKEWTAILAWPGYRVYRVELDERAKTLKLWVRRKPFHRGFECSGCGRRLHELHDVREREIRDLAWSVYRATVVVEVHRVRCPACGVRVEKIEQLPSKAPFSKRFEEIVGQACESAAASQVARRFRLPETTARAIDMRYLERWERRRRKPALRQMGVDEIYRGKNDKFLTVVSNLETGEPLWFGKERKKETLDDFFRSQLVSRQRKRIAAACVDMWEPFRLSMEEWVPGCRIVYDKFHIIQHANDAVDEVRRAEFFRKRTMRDLIKGKKWLLLSRWKNLAPRQRGVLNRLFKMNRRVFKAYMLKESLERLWDYRYEGAMLKYLRQWMDQLRWQRLPAFQKLASTLLKHLDGILNYCRTKVRFGVVEAINGNIRMLINRGRGYKNMRYLLLKAKRMVITNTEYVAFQTTRKAA